MKRSFLSLTAAVVFTGVSGAQITYDFSTAGNQILDFGGPINGFTIGGDAGIIDPDFYQIFDLDIQTAGATLDSVTLNLDSGFDYEFAVSSFNAAGEAGLLTSDGNLVFGGVSGTTNTVVSAVSNGFEIVNPVVSTDVRHFFTLSGASQLTLATSANATNGSNILRINDIFVTGVNVPEPTSAALLGLGGLALLGRRKRA